MARIGAVAVFACASIVLVATAYSGERDQIASAVTRLTVVAAKTPPLHVPRFHTDGTYPKVKGGAADLRAVNAAFRAAVLDDQRGYAAYARRDQASLLPATYRGDYRTAIDRRYLSASSVVVSALLPVTEEVFPGQHGGDGWIGITVSAPSGKRVTISDLFSKPARGLRVLAAAWQARIRRTEGRSCLRTYADAYTPTLANYQAFALTPAGLAVGSWEIEACYRLVTTVPYSILRPYLSPLGGTLVRGVRKPR